VWSKVPKAVFYLFLTTAGINSLIAGCQTYFVVYVTDVLGVEKFQWAVVTAFMALSVSVPAILAGLRMDASGRKRFLILGFLLYPLAMLVFVNATFPMLLVSFFFFGLAQTLQWTSYNSLLGDLTPRELRGKVIGCSQFFMYMSQAFAQLVAGGLYAYVSPQAPFVLLAVGAVPVAAIAFLRVSEGGAREV
jgi:MFS family permease